MSEAKAALERLLGRYLDVCERELESLPTQQYDPAWPSPCQVGEPDARGTIHWQPVERSVAGDFSGLEHALEVEIHTDVKAYYGSFWCGCIEASAEEGGLTLIQIWNANDFDRLGENILGHALAKQRIKAPLTLFFATTDERELMLSVDNTTGRVVLEDPGSPSIREIARSLGEFLDRVDPVAK